MNARESFWKPKEFEFMFAARGTSTLECYETVFRTKQALNANRSRARFDAMKLK